jgi:hypothetical protein
LVRVLVNLKLLTLEPAAEPGHYLVALCSDPTSAQLLRRLYDVMAMSTSPFRPSAAIFHLIYSFLPTVATLVDAHAFRRLLIDSLDDHSFKLFDSILNIFADRLPAEFRYFPDPTDKNDYQEPATCTEGLEWVLLYESLLLLGQVERAARLRDLGYRTFVDREYWHYDHSDRPESDDEEDEEQEDDEESDEEEAEEEDQIGADAMSVSPESERKFVIHDYSDNYAPVHGFTFGHILYDNVLRAYEQLGRPDRLKPSIDFLISLGCSYNSLVDTYRDHYISINDFYH